MITAGLLLNMPNAFLKNEQEMVSAVQALERRRHAISIASCAPAPNPIIKMQLEKQYPGVHHVRTAILLFDRENKYHTK